MKARLNYFDIIENPRGLHKITTMFELYNDALRIAANACEHIAVCLEEELSKTEELLNIDDDELLYETSIEEANKRSLEQRFEPTRKTAVVGKVGQVLPGGIRVNRIDFNTGYFYYTENHNEMI